MSYLRPLTLTGTLLLGFGTASSSIADTALADLKVAGEMHVLVHKTAASACMITAGAAVEGEMADLAASRTRMNTLLAKTAENDMTDQLAAQWQPVDVAFSMILAGDAPGRYLETITGRQAALEFATLAVMDEASRIYEQADDVAMNDVVTFDVAERQEVYVQKIKLLACRMAEEPSVSDVADLKDAVDLFERSLIALRDGVPEMGISAADDYRVQQAIAAAGFDWDAARPVIEKIVANGVATPDDLAALHVRGAALETRMNDVVHAYLAPSTPAAAPAVAFFEPSAE